MRGAPPDPGAVPGASTFFFASHLRFFLGCRQVAVRSASNRADPRRLSSRPGTGARSAWSSPSRRDQAARALLLSGAPRTTRGLAKVWRSMCQPSCRYPARRHAPHSGRLLSFLVSMRPSPARASPQPAARWTTPFRHGTCCEGPSSWTDCSSLSPRCQMTAALIRLVSASWPSRG
jgi:hypothetical protein